MRLIDADALKRKVLKWMPPDPCGREEKESPFETDIVVSLIMEIEEAPTIDALEQEEIIRCKDCKFNKGKYKCFNPKSVAIFPDDNDYCSYAERMESDEE